MTNTVRSSRSREDIVHTLFDLFRWRGFEGAALSDISEATGLGRSSLYHHFPGGKDEMVLAVAGYARRQIDASILQPLRAGGPLPERIDAMLEATRDMYDCGQAPCIVATLMASPGLAPDAAASVRAILKDWISALSDALQAGGLPADEATGRATAAIVDIQGGLLVSRASEDPDVFEAALRSARRILLER